MAAIYQPFFLTKPWRMGGDKGLCVLVELWAQFFQADTHTCTSSSGSCDSHVHSSVFWCPVNGGGCELLHNLFMPLLPSNISPRSPSQSTANTQTDSVFVCVFVCVCVCVCERETESMWVDHRSTQLSTEEPVQTCKNNNSLKASQVTQRPSW